MALQILTLKLDGITAGDYLTWCRDPDPLALDYGLHSVALDADPLGDTITAILDWNQPAPAPSAAAAAAGLPLSPGVWLHPPAITGVPHRLSDERSAWPLDRAAGELTAPPRRSDEHVLTAEP
jgi:hypothetical protein